MLEEQTLGLLSCMLVDEVSPTSRPASLRDACAAWLIDQLCVVCRLT